MPTSRTACSTACRRASRRSSITPSPSTRLSICRCCRRELDHQAARNRARSYRPAEGLEPEFEGLPLDPEPQPGAPFLFTISGLAEEADAGIPALPPLSDEAKAALRQEVGLADDYANMIGREVCTILLHHRLRIQAAITQYVEPQIEAMLEELTRVARRAVRSRTSLRRSEAARIRACVARRPQAAPGAHAASLLA